MKSIAKVLLSVAVFALISIPASAGNIYLTGHDLDLHCSGGAPQCHALGLALDFVASGAPTPTKPMLFLDSGTELQTAAGQSTTKAVNSIQGAGNPFNFVVMDPTSASFVSTPLNTSTYSAIAIASDFTCGGCDLNATEEAAINARKGDIASFFNAGGGLLYLAGADELASYYGSVPIAATAVPVTAPFKLTSAGVTFGLTDPGDDNCCATHNSFATPPSGSALVVLETDSAGNAETLIAKDAKIGGGGITGGGGTTTPEPASMVLFATGLIGLMGFMEFRRRKAFQA